MLMKVTLSQIQDQDLTLSIMLDDLETESRGLEDFFTLTNDLYPDLQDEGTVEWEEESLQKLLLRATRIYTVFSM